FHIGQMVVCLDGSGSCGFLVIGSEYFVDFIGNDGVLIALKNIPGLWHANKFIAIKRKTIELDDADEFAINKAISVHQRRSRCAD
ncbi:hypothetical protein, partial [Faecalicatena contorta]|uniref:hypothetical protein n=1 Tax=Faecalicatena contorta TaxID=39482 RepID=UPI001960942A